MKRLLPWLTRLSLSLGIGLLVVIFVQDAFFHFGFFDRLKLATIDRRFTDRGSIPTPKDSLDVIIVTISDKSEQTVPDPFPFPRSYYARAIRNLSRAGVRAIGIDLTFELPDINGPKNDQDLFNTIRQYRNVAVAGKTEMRSEQGDIKRADENYHSVFYAADSSVGVVYVPEDGDGIYRRYLPFAKVPGQEICVPTLSFAIFNKVLGLPSTATAKDEADAFVLGNRRIPKYDEISMLINYYGPANRTFQQYDIADILDDETFRTKEEKELQCSINAFDDPDIGLLHANIFKNKVVLIGPATPESKDLFPVSISDPESPDKILMYGVELHANALQTLIDENFITVPSKPISTIYTLSVSMITFLVVSVLKILKVRFQFLLEIAALLFVGLESYVILATAQYAFVHYNAIILVVSPLAAVFANYLGSAVYQYLTERKQKVMIKGMFSQYLNPAVVNELIAHPEKLRLGGERKELTVLFSDIAGFTTISETLSAEDLVPLLNEYLSEMTDLVFKNDGTLDKYEGDAVMAFWGAPIGLANNALSAVTAAVEMQEKLVEFRERWKNEGKPAINIRIGLNTGDMVVGNMGGSAKFDYTVIGDSVNLGSRLEGANKQYGTKIMIAERTYELVKDHFVCRELDLLVVKGKTKPIKVFEVLGRRDGSVSQEKQKAIETFCTGLTHFREKKFSEAIQEFVSALAVDPDDGPSKLYIDRSKFYIENPPPEDWNGVFIMKTK